jgi:plasmid stabilization system protein ParE
VPTIVYSARALTDLDRLVDFLAQEDPALAHVALERIAEAIRMLDRHPYIGRLVRGGLRELVISRGRTGYVALYRVVPSDDLVEILAVRHQPEAGYA